MTVSIYLSIYLSISMYLSINLSVSFSLCLQNPAYFLNAPNLSIRVTYTQLYCHIYLSIYLNVSIYKSICQFFSVSTKPRLFPQCSLSVNQSHIHTIILSYLSIYQSASLSVNQSPPISSMFPISLTHCLIHTITQTYLSINHFSKSYNKLAICKYSLGFNRLSEYFTNIRIIFV